MPSQPNSSRVARHRDKQGDLHEFDRPEGDDHEYTYPGALSKWHDEQLQSIDGTHYTVDEDFDQLDKRPDPPDALPEDAIPIRAIANCGDVQWVEANSPSEPDFYDLYLGCPDIIFDTLAQINRFAFHRFEADLHRRLGVHHDCPATADQLGERTAAGLRPD